MNVKCVVVDFANKTRWQLMKEDRRCRTGVVHVSSENLAINCRCCQFWFFSFHRSVLVLLLLLHEVLTIFTCSFRISLYLYICNVAYKLHHSLQRVAKHILSSTFIRGTQC